MPRDSDKFEWVLAQDATPVVLLLTPTLELLGRGVLQSMTEGERRVHFGLPISAQIDRGRARLYGGAGYFTRGVWFTGV